MRISVVGTSGSGKTTLARKIAAELALPFIEIDAINWQADWYNLDTHEPEELRRRIDAATRWPGWVIDGNYGSTLGNLVRDRATHLVWLDYGRPLIMARVLRRSFWRALTGRELWPGTGNRERWTQWLKADHPIRWAWRTWARRREQYEKLAADPSSAHLTIVRLRHPREADAAIETLRRDRDS